MDENSPGFTGYRVDLEDRHRAESRAFAAPYSILMAGDWQTSPDIFDWWHVRNQLQVSSCRGHSGAANARVSYYMKNGLPDLDGDGKSNEKMEDDFSAMWVYLISQQEDNLLGRDQGATIGGGRRAMMKRGNAREVVFPYPGRYETQIPSDAGADADKFKFARYSQFEGSASVEKLFDWIGSGQGGVDWGTVWPLPFVGGCLVKSCPRGLRGGGHATAPIALVRGEDVARWVPALKRELKPDEYCLAVANSHSEHAQYRGFYFVTMQGAAEILDHGFTEAIGLSDLSTPKPRKVDWRRESALG